MKVFFFTYVMLIPIVPLVGAEIYRKNDDKYHKKICMFLFVVQLIVSILSVVFYFKL